MIVIEFVRQTIPGGWKQTPSGWVSGNCPMCTTRGHRADTRKRGGLMFQDDKFQYNCFNCGFKTGWSPGRKINGRLQELLVQFGADPAQIQRVNFELLKEQEEANIAQQFIQQDTPREVVIDWKENSLPPESVRLQDVDTSKLTESQLQKFIAACEYVNERGVDFYENWHWSSYSHFSNRVILPFHYKGRTVGYTARWVGKTPNKETPKYYLQSPKHFVYNIDAQKSHKYTIVTEGQFDALLVGGVAMQGNTPSMTQCDIVDKLETEIIVVPDADRAGMELVKTAIKRGWNVSFPPWEDCKDAADAVQKYGRLFTVRSILDSAESNSTKIQVLAKSYCR
jgi:hypothetical protein